MGIQGDTYAIAGNILISQEVITDMETAYLETEGSLAHRLMASLQAAKRPGALDQGVSSASAFIRVASPEDIDSTLGNLSLDLNVWITSEIFEPIDELQTLFDHALTIDDELFVDGVKIYPNPASHKITVKSVTKTTHVDVYNTLGQNVAQKQLQGNLATINISALQNGVYFVKVMAGKDIKSTQKLIKRNY